MKFNSQIVRLTVAAMVVITMVAGCKGHKKAKCNDCPKWSKTQLQNENRFLAKTQGSQSI